MESTLEVRSKRGFWLVRGLGAVAFAVACAVSMRTANAWQVALGAIGAAMFGAFALYALRQGLRRGPRLVLRPGGFEAADLGVGLVSWSDIETVEQFGSAEAPFIAFHLRDPTPWIARQPPWPRFVRRLLAAQGLPTFSVNLIGVDKDPGVIAFRARALHVAAG